MLVTVVFSVFCHQHTDDDESCRLLLHDVWFERALLRSIDSFELDTYYYSILCDVRGVE
jgi:hypothetical protein